MNGFPQTTQSRPLVTFALLAYNQEKYIREAVQGALGQTYEAVEIILSDDCSSDRTFEIIQKMAAEYDGPHIVRVMRNSRNLGVASHFNSLIAHSNGQFIVLAAGDDVSLPCRCTEIVEYFATDKLTNFVDVAGIEIDDSGSEIEQETFFDAGKLELNKFIKRPPQGLSGAARAYRKAALCAFPPLDPSCPTEDTTSVLRCLMTGTGYLLDRRLILRRHHDRNLSGKTSMKSMNLGAIQQQYLRDIEHYFHSGVGVSSNQKILIAWAKGNIARRTFMQDISNGRMTFRRMLTTILRTKNLDTRTTGALIRMYLKYQLPKSFRKME